MSAICGLIDLSAMITQEAKERLKSGLDPYHFDKRGSIEDKHFFFECGLQWVTEEAKGEILPYEDEKFCMTVDAIIDNRAELMETFGIEDSRATDSFLILESYKKWGVECVNHLLGDYAFAIWDKEAQQLVCVRDHVGKRTLYYEYHKGKICFSTILKPILTLQTERKCLNEKWLADFLAMDNAVQEIEIDQTLYEGIRQIPPGHYLVFQENQIQVKQYWYPQQVKELRLESDEAYEKAFREVFDEAVRCRLRSFGKVGIMLSSGLDSTAVGAVAAKLMAKENKMLEAFTEIPVSSYKSDMDSSVIVDESSYVEEMAKKYPNIHNHFNSFEEHNSYKDIDDTIKELERPYKVIENIYWLRSLTKEAAAEGCKILLDGQFGNYTISQGYTWTYWNTLFKRFRWIKLIREIKIYGKCKHLGRKFLYKKVLIRYWENVKGKFLVHKELATSIINKNLESKWHCFKRIKQKGYARAESSLYDYKKQKEAITNFILLSHLGCMETNTSLVDGLLRRDPTRDKRVIEFCLSIPTTQYIYHGEPRALIRRVMKDEVPECIRLNYTSRGRQAADWIYRIQSYEQEIYEEIQSILKDEKIGQYIDVKVVSRYLEQLKNGINQGISEKELQGLFYVIIFYRFMKQQA